MSYWTIPQEMQVPVKRKNVQGKKNNLFFSMLFPFALAVMGIPVYVMIILKIIGMMQ